MWAGHVNGNDKEVTGKVDIPNLSEEHEDMEDVDIDVSLTTKGPESDALKEMLRKGTGAKSLRQLLGEYVSALKTEFSAGLILPKKSEHSGTTAGSVVPKQATTTSSKTKVNVSSSTNEARNGMQSLDIGGGCRLEVGSLEVVEHLKCTGQEVYNALTMRDMLQIFTNGEVKMSEQAEPKGTFEMLGGNISGSFVEVSHPSETS